jgi:hypothetical protein
VYRPPLHSSNVPYYVVRRLTSVTVNLQLPGDGLDADGLFPPFERIDGPRPRRESVTYVVRSMYVPADHLLVRSRYSVVGSGRRG